MMDPPTPAHRPPTHQLASAPVPPAVPAQKRSSLSQAEQREIRSQIGMAGKSGTNLAANVHHYRTRLQNLAKRIPDFESYRQMVVDDLRDASDHDRMHKIRTAHNLQDQWRRLFKYWAERAGETRLVYIGWLGTGGAYECKLVERREVDRWERFIDAGVQAGVPLTVLNDLYKKYHNAPAQTVRANGRRFSPRGTGPAALPGEPIETLLSAFKKGE